MEPICYTYTIILLKYFFSVVALRIEFLIFIELNFNSYNNFKILFTKKVCSVNKKVTLVSGFTEIDHRNICTFCTCIVIHLYCIATNM